MPVLSCWEHPYSICYQTLNKGRNQAKTRGSRRHHRDRAGFYLPCPQSSMASTAPSAVPLSTWRHTERQESRHYYEPQQGIQEARQERTEDAFVCTEVPNFTSREGRITANWQWPTPTHWLMRGATIVPIWGLRTSHPHQHPIKHIKGQWQNSQNPYDSQEK